MNNNNQLVKRNTITWPSRFDVDKVERIYEKSLSYLQVSNEDYDKILGQIGIDVFKAYLPMISSDIYEPIENCKDNYITDNGIVYFDITKWVRDPEEKNLDKLVNMYETLSDQDCNIALIYERKSDKCKVTLAVASNKSEDRVKSNELGERLYAAIEGNFPGVEINNRNDDKWSGYGTPSSLVYKDKSVSVASITNIPSEKSEDYISQSMEKLLDGVIPEGNKRYTLVLMATPNKNIEELKFKLYNAYSYISKDSQIQTNSTISYNVSKSVSNNVGFNTSTGVNVNAVFVGANKNFGESYSRSVSKNISFGKTDGVTKTYTNYGIKHTMDNIEQQIKRLEECSALGLWDFSAYVISNEPKLTKNVAHSYLSLTQGEESYLGKGCVNYWDYTQKESVNMILNSISRLRHPEFILRDGVNNGWLMYPMLVTATMPISGKELAYSLNFPRKSVSGLPVLESASFGREVQRYENVSTKTKNIFVGNIVHMRKDEGRNVEIDLNSLSSHAFVTGSTGAGKTNVILQLLQKANEQNIHFLVIEPAKGEYKNEIGGICKVYGTNPRLSELIKLNPFSFPSNISVFEHIDRLVEILNACWPMYAAMPAVLKDAIERAYRNKGWDLESVYNVNKEFPTFFDVMETLPDVINESEYSADTKGDYIGSLVTRVKSMTNGLNGTILCSDKETSVEDLFEQNVIVDLSRVSASETKALLMGVLVMKLQEYRINQEENAFSTDLRHLTVLEEAHNLLRKTSIQQSSESSNLQGKSVEMITNSIAEMRAYGEGFVIVDQAPGLLDEAVIRNTNTKISLRLPDKGDRELVGKAAALTDIQIDEIAKLPRGVAVVYQNDWVEAVLCHFVEFTNKSKMKPYKYDIGVDTQFNPADAFISCLFPSSDKIELTVEQVNCIKNWIEKLSFSDYTKRLLRSALVDGKVDDDTLGVIAYNIFEGKKIARILLDSYDTEEGLNNTKKYVRDKYNLSDNCNIASICEHIYQKVCVENMTGEIERRYQKIGGGLW